MQARPRSLPRVLIDARMIGEVSHGIARYVTHLARGLRAIAESPEGLKYDPVFLTHRKIAEPELGSFEQIKSDISFLSPSELWRLHRVVASSGAALYHSPSFASLFAKGPFSLAIPWIQTIHDLNHLHFGSWAQKTYYSCVLRPFARGAKVLATVSAFSQRELSQWLKAPAESIEIVANAMDANLLEPVSQAQGLEILNRFGLKAGQYFFSLSNSKPHKNIALLVKAYESFRANQKSKPWPLVLSIPPQPEFMGQEVLTIGTLKDPEVLALRAFAGAVVFPSLYEGFGLPPVEAALSGVPVLVSDIPPHREGLVDLSSLEAAWVSPLDLAGWSHALGLASEGMLQAASWETRLKILSRFSESTLASHMDRLYRRVLDQKT